MCARSQVQLAELEYGHFDSALGQQLDRDADVLGVTPEPVGLDVWPIATIWGALGLRTPSRIPPVFRRAHLIYLRFHKDSAFLSKYR